MPAIAEGREMLRVLGRSTSGNVQKVVWLLEELRMPYQREDYGRQFNNTQDASYLALNPTGKIPTLVDGEVVVWESNTILRYICSKPGGQTLYPTEPAARSRVERWMDWQLAALNGPYLGVFKEAKKSAGERPPSWATDAKELGVQLEILDRGIGNQPWIAGDEISIADICLGPIIARCLNFPIELSALARLRAWREKIGTRPAFRRASG
jgi:glutathione S-transferase